MVTEFSRLTPTEMQMLANQQASNPRGIKGKAKDAAVYVPHRNKSKRDVTVTLSDGSTHDIPYHILDLNSADAIAYLRWTIGPAELAVVMNQFMSGQLNEQVDDGSEPAQQ